MLVSHIMTKHVVSVSMEDNLQKVKEIFESTHFHHLLVVEDNVLQGVISDRDLLRAISPAAGTVAETAKDAATLQKRVHQIMSRKPISLRPDASIHDAIALFNQHSISCIPIVDDHEHPAGIVSWRDIMRALKPANKTTKPN